MPGEDGLSLCRSLRETSQIPVVLLTARGEEVDRIIGLEMGADDYISKPFSPRELVARIAAVLRRTGRLPPRQTPPGTERVRFGDWTLDTGQRELIGADGVALPLSSSEFRLLTALLERSQDRAHPQPAARSHQGPRRRPFRPLDRQSRLAPAQEDRARPQEPAATSRQCGWRRLHLRHGPGASLMRIRSLAPHSRRPVDRGHRRGGGAVEFGRRRLFRPFPSSIGIETFLNDRMIDRAVAVARAVRTVPPQSRELVMNAFAQGWKFSQIPGPVPAMAMDEEEAPLAHSGWPICYLPTRPATAR